MSQSILIAYLQSNGIDERTTAELGYFDNKLKAALLMFVLESIVAWTRFIPV